MRTLKLCAGSRISKSSFSCTGSAVAMSSTTTLVSNPSDRHPVMLRAPAYFKSMEFLANYFSLAFQTGEAAGGPPLAASASAGDDNLNQDPPSKKFTTEHVPAASTNVYFSEETSREWRDHMAATNPRSRHPEEVKRRIGHKLWLSARKGTCFLCWMPLVCCMCSKILHTRPPQPNRGDGRLEVDALGEKGTTKAGDGESNNSSSSTSSTRAGTSTAEIVSRNMDISMVLHADEFLRSTNTGHVAALAMNARVLISGLPEHDEAIHSLADTADEVHYLLYPEGGAPLLKDLVVASSGHDDGAAKSSGTELGNDNTDAGVVHQSDEADVACTTSSTGGMSGGSSARARGGRRVHLLLSDATWSGAHRVNRRIPRSVTRCALLIDPAYTPLFAALRKQTRATGVSTLEATALAVCEVLEATTSSVANTRSGEDGDVAFVRADLAHVMRFFVDAACVLKNAPPPFAVDPSFLALLESKRNVSQVHKQMEEEERRELSIDPIEAQQLLAKVAPVCSYCYACDVFVGWCRMPQHVLGASHREAVDANPTLEPSIASRTDASKVNFHVRAGHEIPLQK